MTNKQIEETIKYFESAEDWVLECVVLVIRRMIIFLQCNPILTPCGLPEVNFAQIAVRR